MKITFLIGNGFDLNLGLETKFCDFISVYKDTTTESENLKKFYDKIKDDEELWASAEIALGQYTENLKKGEAAIFSECHVDICEALSKYLEDKQVRFNALFDEEKVISAFSRVNTLLTPFPPQERTSIEQVFSKHNNEIREFNFICYNYTDTLDRCLETAGKSDEALGYHKHGTSVMRHSFSPACHVHGTLKSNMVFGVNDDSQIANNEVFDCVNGDIYKNLLIKQRANASYQEDTDANIAKLLNESNIIYIYGMSLGATDKLWWQRICRWLNVSSEHHLIIQQYSMPSKGVLPVRYQIAERERKNAMIVYGEFEESVQKRLEDQIHITDDNIFAEIKNMASAGTLYSKILKKNTADVTSEDAMSAYANMRDKGVGVLI